MVEDEGHVKKAEETAKLIWASQHIDNVLDQTDAPGSDSDGSEDMGGQDVIAGITAQV